MSLPDTPINARAPGLDRTRVRFVVSLAVSAALLALALHAVDGAGLLASVRDARQLSILAAVGVYFLDVGLRSVRWSLLLGDAKRLSPARLYPVLLVGYMANNLLPGRVGDLSRSYLVRRRDGVSASTVFASVALERLLDGLTVLALLSATFLLLPSSGLLAASWIAVVTRLAAILFGGMLVVCLLLVVAPERCHRVGTWLARFLPPRFQAPGLALLDHFIAGLAVLGRPAVLAQTFVLSIVIWIVGAVTYLLVASAFDVRLSLIDAVAAICVVNLVTAVPQAPAGLGAFEAAAKTVFVLLGAGATTALGVTLALHLVLFLPVVVAGLVVLWSADLSLGSLRGRPEPEQQLTAAETSR